MRYDRVSDKIEERHRLSNLIRSGYHREKSRYRPEKAKVRNVGNGNGNGPWSCKTNMYIIWVGGVYVARCSK